MHITQQKHQCNTCRLKCDIYFTAKEMKLEKELKPEHVRYQKHETISKQNHTLTHAIILLEGHAKMFIEGVYGKNIMIGLAVPGNYIGLMAVFGSDTYPYNVRAITDSFSCQINIEFVKKLYAENPTFQHSLNIAFGQSVQAIMKKLVSLNQKQLRARMAESLLYLAEVYEGTSFKLTITRKDIGELAGITGENAVRVLSDFKQEGLIFIDGKNLQLLRPELLEKISEAG